MLHPLSALCQQNQERRDFFPESRFESGDIGSPWVDGVLTLPLFSLLPTAF